MVYLPDRKYSHIETNSGKNIHQFYKLGLEDNFHLEPLQNFLERERN